MAEIGKDIAKATALLRAGKLVAIPTETVYGLAANALDPTAVASIFQAKKRPFFDPLIVHISSMEEVNRYASYFPEKAKELANHFWPGPLTLILPKQDNIPDLVTAGQSTVGLRMPNHPLTLELLANLEFPLAAPSANPFGYVSPTLPQHVEAQLGMEIDYILDGGACEVGLESTIVSVDQMGEAVLLRLGGLDLKEIEKITGNLHENLHKNSNPNAPGQLDMHYAPGCKLVFESNLTEQIAKLKTEKLGFIRFSEQLEGIAPEFQFVLAPDKNMRTAASRLFSILRELDNQHFTMAIIEPVKNEGLGRAINDRLNRAAIRT
jgi:L-threonylcarbamoyladenylate synthase